MQKAEFLKNLVLCLHSQIIYGDLVETLEPYYRIYMKYQIISTNVIVPTGYFCGQVIVFFIKFSHNSLTSSQVPFFI